MDFLLNNQQQIVGLIAFFFALTIHEFSHALVAYYYGDRTAAQAGRLTLNPLAHIDLFGTILLPLFLFLSGTGIVIGWAKPVPVNYYNLRDQKWGPALVSLAGPAANFIFGVICLVLLKLVIVYTTLGATLLFIFLFSLCIINFLLMVFNLIPIPPLDGSKILFALLPSRWAGVAVFLEKYGLVILLALLIFGSGFLNLIFSWVLGLIERLI